MWFKTILAWFDSQAVAGYEKNPDKIELLRILPFIILHLVCFAVFWVEFSAIGLIVAIVLYVLRMFAITGFYHRYFSHKACWRAFKIDHLCALNFDQAFIRCRLLHRCG